MHILFISKITFFTGLILLLTNVSTVYAALGQLKITCSPPATILADGQMIDAKPQAKVSIGLDPGEHIITTFAPGYVQESWPVKIYPQKQIALDIILVKQGQNRDEMVTVSAGTLTMGVDAERADWLAGRLKVDKKLFLNCQPLHDVAVKAFQIDKYEVTNQQYAKFVKAANHRAPKHWSGGSYHAGHDDFPVVNVSWEDAAAYAKWAGKRLPTEAEWEMAARGNKGFVFPWGQVFRADSANSHESMFKAPCITGRYEKGASPVHCMDMGGNVAEWTDSTYEAYPGQKLADKEANAKTHKVVRGGSWKSNPHEVTTVYRNYLTPDTVSDNVGFRCVR
ncbi:MAG: SUMF1/EgtB/PvdO family nonheme iron enzyme [Candidatus Schekmanbacteria bacterium]|nr:SUMF1/EgtB/PvdO family nonheme iron enzyme [Candidatus Schekmanbacteria bacterium]